MLTHHRLLFRCQQAPDANLQRHSNPATSEIEPPAFQPCNRRSPQNLPRRSQSRRRTPGQACPPRQSREPRRPGLCFCVRGRRFRRRHARLNRPGHPHRHQEDADEERAQKTSRIARLGCGASSCDQPILGHGARGCEEIMDDGRNGRRAHESDVAESQQQ